METEFTTSGSPRRAALAPLPPRTGRVFAHPTRYDPYGGATITRNSQVQSSDVLGQAWTYAARFADAETGLLSYRTRHYDPTSGRFLQRDWLGFAAGPSLYEYVSSAPVNATDPLGQDPKEKKPKKQVPIPKQGKNVDKARSDMEACQSKTTVGCCQECCGFAVWDAMESMEETRKRAKVACSQNATQSERNEVNQSQGLGKALKQLLEAVKKFEERAAWLERAGAAASGATGLATGDAAGAATDAAETAAGEAQGQGPSGEDLTALAGKILDANELRVLRALALSNKYAKCLVDAEDDHGAAKSGLQSAYDDCMNACNKKPCPHGGTAAKDPGEQWIWVTGNKDYRKEPGWKPTCK